MKKPIVAGDLVTYSGSGDVYTVKKVTRKKTGNVYLLCDGHTYTKNQLEHVDKTRLFEFGGHYMYVDWHAYWNPRIAISFRHMYAEMSELLALIKFAKDFPNIGPVSKKFKITFGSQDYLNYVGVDDLGIPYVKIGKYYGCLHHLEPVVNYCMEQTFGLTSKQIKEIL